MGRNQCYVHLQKGKQNEGERDNEIRQQVQGKKKAIPSHPRVGLDAVLMSASSHHICYKTLKSMMLCFNMFVFFFYF